MSPITLCLVCNKNLNSDKELKCDNCKQPLHTTCSQLSRSEIQLLTAKDRRITYFCVNCEQQRTELKELKNLVLDLKKEIEELKNANSVVTKSAPELTETIISEINERNRRASNILVFNVKESSSQSREQRINHDIQQSSEIIKKIAPEVRTENIRVFRLGTVEGQKDRPLKIMLSSATDALAILKGKNRLGRDSGIVIRSDQTPLQRDYLKGLQQTLEVRKKNGEQDLTIKYKNGVPEIMKLPKN